MISKIKQGNEPIYFLSQRRLALRIRFVVCPHFSPVNMVLFSLRHDIQQKQGCLFVAAKLFVDQDINTETVKTNLNYQYTFSFLMKRNLKCRTKTCWPVPFQNVFVLLEQKKYAFLNLQQITKIPGKTERMERVANVQEEKHLSREKCETLLRPDEMRQWFVDSRVYHIQNKISLRQISKTQWSFWSGFPESFPFRNVLLVWRWCWPLETCKEPLS